MSEYERLWNVYVHDSKKGVVYAGQIMAKTRAQAQSAATVRYATPTTNYVEVTATI